MEATPSSTNDDLQRAGAREAAEQARASSDPRVQRLNALRAEHGIEPDSIHPDEVRVVAAAALLELSAVQVRDLYAQGRLRGVTREIHTSRGRSERIFLELDGLLDTHRRQPQWLADARERATGSAEREAQRYREMIAAGSSWQARHERERELDRERRLAARRTRSDGIARALARITVNRPSRRAAPETVTVHAGPTNSGKTHQALQALSEAGSGTYAAPLRFLAREAHERLAAQLGEDRVGLITGEERVNDTAPVLCTTAEMAPLSGHLLVLDEVHWAADPDRGSAWARLLAAGEYRHLHLASAPDALPLLRAAFPDAALVVHQRLSPLSYVGVQHIHRLEAGTAVVAFSRNAVLGLASALTGRGRPVAALYGAMPVQTRRRELERFSSGEAGVLCTTDVIGHGVNVPTLRTVVFAETQKFDGRRRRNLHPWEIAQIAGRAGRFGLADDGEVAVLSGSRFFTPDANLVRRSLTATLDVGDGLRGHRIVSTGVLRPRLADLRCETAEELAFSIQAWKLAAVDELGSGWLRVDDCAPMLAWYQRLADDQLATLEVSDAWSLIRAPADTDKHAALFTNMVRCVLGRTSGARGIRELAATNPKGLDLGAAEKLASELAVLRWFAYAFTDRCPVTPEQAAAAEARAAARASELLAATLRSGQIGRCQSCGLECAPWFAECDSCRHTHTGKDKDDARW